MVVFENPVGGWNVAVFTDFEKSRNLGKSSIENGINNDNHFGPFLITFLKSVGRIPTELQPKKILVENQLFIQKRRKNI